MLITFRIQQDDYKKFSKFALKRASNKTSEKKSFIASFMIWFLVTIVFMLIFQVVDKKSFDFDIPTAVIVLLPFLVGIGIYFAEILKVQRNTLPTDNGFLLSESTIEIKDDGLQVLKDCATSFFSWEAIESVSVNDGDYYLFLDNMYAIIIPNSAFSNNNQAEEFRAVIEKYV